MRVLITQSNYIPWRGYFAAMRSVDQVVLLDSAQYTRRDWRNRNRIRHASGKAQWLTIPVETKGRFEQAICEVRIPDPRWADAHRGSIESRYRRFPHWADVASVADLLAAAAELSPMLSDVNAHVLTGIAQGLGITAPIATDRTLDRPGSATEKLAAIAAEWGATTYVSSPVAQAYMDEDVFARAGIDVEYLDYGRLPPDADGACLGGELSIVDAVARLGFAGAAVLASFKPGGPAADA